jgi:hypothetical protein
MIYWGHRREFGFFIKPFFSGLINGQFYSFREEGPNSEK